MTQSALPPETLEGWYALHQVFEVDRTAGAPFDALRGELTEDLSAAFGRDERAGTGWTVAVELIGSTADLLLFHLRPSLEALRDVQRQVDDIAPMSAMRQRYSFLSVTEAGMYHLSAKIKDEAEL